LKQNYQCKSLNILGTDLGIFLNDFNTRRESIQKYLLVTQGCEALSVQKRIKMRDNISVTLRLEAKEIRLDLILPTAWSERSNIKYFFLLSVQPWTLLCVRWEFMPGMAQAVAVRSTMRRS